MCMMYNILIYILNYPLIFAPYQASHERIYISFHKLNQSGTFFSCLSISKYSLDFTANFV